MLIRENYLHAFSRGELSSQHDQNNNWPWELKSLYNGIFVA